MTNYLLTQKDILRLVGTHQLTAEEGTLLIKQLQNKDNSEDAIYYFSEFWEERTLEPEIKTDDLKGPIIIFDTTEDHYTFFSNTYSDKVILVQPGDTFAESTATKYVINPFDLSNYEQLFTHLKNNDIIPRHIIHFWSRDNAFSPDEDDLNKQLYNGIYSLYALSQALLKMRLKKGVTLLFFYINNSQTTIPTYGGLSGFAKTIGLENPKYRYRIIELKNVSPATYPTIIQQELATDSPVVEIKYKDTKRYVNSMAEVSPMTNLPCLIKKNGIFIITGGLGGLGLIFSRFLLQKYNATLILTGRSPLNSEKEETLQQLKEIGGEVQYIQSDISNKDSVVQLVREVTDRYTHINGIIHCAGLNRDAYIIKKKKEEIDQVLGPKIFGTLYLDEITKDIGLDFFCVCSSTAATIGNTGQCDYAFSNRFLDFFMSYRNNLQEHNKRKGASIAINWPLWAEGGMQVDDATRQWLKNNIGMIPLKTENGIKAFEYSLTTNISPLAVVEGFKQKLKDVFGVKERVYYYKSSDNAVSSQKTASGIISKTPEKASTVSPLVHKVKNDILEIITKLLKVTKEEIDIDEDLADCGVDSIGYTKISNEINTKFNLDLTPAIFFEYPDLQSFFDYFIDEYADTLSSYYGIAFKSKDETPVAPEPEKTDDKIQPAPSSPTTGDGPGSHLSQKVTDDILTIITKILKIEKDEIDNDEDLADCGVDSIGYTKISNEINTQYDLDLTPAIFFEYPDIRSFVNYFIDEYNDRLVSYYGLSIEPIDQKPVIEEKTKETTPAIKTSKKTPVIIQTKASEKTTQAPSRRDEPIAVIGMSGKMPDADNLQEFWENIANKTDSISLIPSDRWDWKKYYSESKTEPNKMNSKWGGFMNDIDKFDPLFFGLSPREAVLMDPQQRIFLEIVWETIENAGYKASDLSGTKTGIFVGVAAQDYYELLLRQSPNVEAYTTTGTTHSILPNRISYLFNFTGPSEPIDTACSSSLVAIHKAIESIHMGNSDMAIAGGINALITPTSYIAFSKAGMLSPDGKCKTFDERANGYVRGEGGGAVLLKPLSKAKADGDFIYAVIKGTSINHGGKAKSLTAPNPNAQAQLIIEAWNEAGVAPETITYIEAHGTGTSLGDPIEIQGLKNAFSTLYEKWHKTLPEKPVCGIGAVKTNIGHLETAAGIAGVLKILLSMKNEQLPGTVHFKHLNPYIKLDKSPFYIVDKTKAWETPYDVPRRAGVSSFGFGGVNSHLVFEDYAMPMVSPEKISDEHVIILSAKDKDRLQEYALKLAGDLKRIIGEGGRISKYFTLENIAYTLMNGREEFEERMGFIAATTDELIEKLIQYGEGNFDPNIIETGNTSYRRRKTDTLIEDEEGEEFVQILINKTKLKKLLHLWVSGTIINWDLLPSSTGRQRIPLSTYPFAKESYWVPIVERDNFTTDVSKPKLHMMLDTNISTFQEQAFSKVFTNDEFYLRDHVFGNQCIVPGAALLELIRAAGAFSSGQEVKKLKNIVFGFPIVGSDTGKEVKISLLPVDDSAQFEISSVTSDNTTVIHSQGTVEYTPTDESFENIDIEAVKSRLTNRMKPEDFYQSTLEIGAISGKTDQTMNEIYYTDDKILVKLCLHEETKGYQNLVLHPSLTDGSFHTIVALLTTKQQATKPSVLFSVGEVTILKPLIDTCFVYSTPIDLTNTKLHKYNITIYNTHGEPIIIMKDVTYKEVNVDILGRAKDSEIPKTDFYYKPIRQELPYPKKPNKKLESLIIFDTNKDIFNLIDADKKILILPSDNFETPDNNVFKINPTNKKDFVRVIKTLQENNIHIDKILYLWNYSDTSKLSLSNLDNKLNTGIYSLFYLSQSLIELKVNKTQLLYIINEPENHMKPEYNAVSGFTKSLKLENPNYIHRIIKIADGRNTPKQLIDTLLAEFDTGTDGEITYDDNLRKIKKIIPYTITDKNETLLKQEGVYIITGGMGGLGLIFARYLAEKYNANLVLTGRSQLNEQKKAKIQEIEERGGKVLYIPADVTKPDDVSNLIKQAKKSFTHINGIIHAAGIIKDDFLINKNITTFNDVITPKIKGAINLDASTKDEKLDFFVMFSSISALGSTGQCDYSFGNSFLDEFAHYRNTLTNRNKRNGISVSINWPLWRNGGMQIDEAFENNLRETVGMQVLDDKKGIKAFEDIIKSGETQVIVFDGIKNKIHKILGITENKPQKSSQLPQKRPETSNNTIREQIIVYLKNLFSKQTALPTDRIDADTAFDNFGIDSILIMNLNNEIEKDFGSISKTLFFEYNSINELADYFIKNYPDTIKELFSSHETPEKPTPIEHEKAHDNIHPVTKSRFTTIKGASDFLIPSSQNKDIAIIGISGKFPMADTVEELWENLKMGKDCITEIPPSRWDYHKYFDNDKSKKGKTYTKWGGFLHDIDKFDTLFFNISPRDAEMLDPQSKLFLESSWECFEDAGYSLKKLKNNMNNDVGVFTGAMWTDYQLYTNNDTDVTMTYHPDVHICEIPNRVSYFFGFNGPSIAVDTACSSSLTALHLAVQSLKADECKMALVGGVNLSVHPNKYQNLSVMGFASTDGRCKSFGENGDGYVPGEGVGTVLLKPLDKAIEDNDRIYAVVKGSAINHGGRTNGFSVPNPNAQCNVILKAIEDAAINPRTISYLESHGTGTSLGDPIEIRGLTKAFEKYTHDKQFCSLGSIKSNIGHLEAAAGIAQVIKTVLQFKYKQLVPSIHSDKLNPNIDMTNTPFYVQKTVEEWKNPVIQENNTTKSYPLRVGISSFGAGGANAHVILEDYQQEASSNGKKADKDHIIVFSAKNDDRLRQCIIRFLAFIKHEENKNINKGHFTLSNIAYNLQIGREHMTSRLAFIVKNLAELRQKLEEIISNEPTNNSIYKGNTLVDDFDKSIDQEMIDQYISNNELSKIAELWAVGADINWQLFYTDSKTVILSLPSYPFAKNSYWVPGPTIDESKEKPAVIDRPENVHKETKIKMPTKIESSVIELFAQLLKLKKDKINLLTPIIDFGIDSISLLELLKKINSQFGMDIELEDLMDLDNIQAVIQYIAGQPSQKTQKTIEKPETKKPEKATDKITKKTTRDTGQSKPEIQTDIISLFSKTLKLNQAEINISIPILDFGIDSISLLEILKKLNTKYNLDFELEDLMDLNNIEALIHHISGQKGETSEIIIEKTESKKPKNDNKKSTKKTTRNTGQTKSKIQTDIISLFSKTLKLNQNEIHVSIPILDFGIDSISLLEILKKLNTMYNLDLELEDLMDLDTIEKIVTHIHNTIKD